MSNSKRVICRQLGDVAIERVVVGEAKRVFYIELPPEVGENPGGLGPIGFPKSCVFEYVDGLAGKKLSEQEWATLKPLMEKKDEERAPQTEAREKLRLTPQTETPKP